MVGKIRYKIAKTMGKIGIRIVKFGSGMGKSFPGMVFFKFGTYEALNNLSKESKLGSILVTGTNGKTTTITLLSKLLSNDIPINCSFESNTINAIATALLRENGDLSVFEYGIRDLAHGIPDTVQRLVDPIGVVYTTISREHTQVAGIKNTFENYFKAKSLLSANMKKGVIVTNCDDPRTAYIGIQKEKDVKVNYFGFDIDVFDIFKEDIVECPNCGSTLNYSQRFMNHRGIYSCPCGFKRPEPNMKISNLKVTTERFYFTLEGKLFNYPNDKNVEISIRTSLPSFGIHNLYNCLSSATAYITFTPKIENIEDTINKIFESVDMSILPPGRFEVVKSENGKFIGLGQGDNGDAAKANALFMNTYIDGPLEFIYTTPDENEEEIFEDHLEAIKALNPDHLIVVPGRKSVDIARDYYDILKKDFNSDFYPLSYDKMDERVEKLYNLTKESNYDFIIMTGCGEEQLMWDQIKNKIKK